MTDRIDYSIVVPVYNGGRSIPDLCGRIMQVLQNVVFEIVFVDDGSSDDSWQKITRLRNENPGVVKGIQLWKNYGQHAALSCGFGFCTGRYTVTIDDDLQHDPEDILLLIDQQKKTAADVVYGVSDKQYKSAIRMLGTKYVEFESKYFDGNEFRPSSFRLLDTAIAHSVARHTNSFINLDNLIKWYTSSFSFVAVRHTERIHGTSGYNLTKLTRHYLNGVVNYSAVPLKVMTVIGFVFSIIFFLLGLLFVVKKLFFNVPIGYTSTIVAILFCSSIIVFCLGVIGQYLFRMYVNQQHKPLFSIKQTLNGH